MLPDAAQIKAAVNRPLMAPLKCESLEILPGTLTRYSFMKGNTVVASQWAIANVRKESFPLDPMAITRHRRSAVVLVAAALGSVATFAVSSPAQALTISTFSDSTDAVTPQADAIFGSGTPAISDPMIYLGPDSSFAFKNSGIKVTFSDPKKSSTPAVSRSNKTLGTCLGGQRPATVAVCGNPTGPSPQINKITLTFDKAVKLLSTSGVMRSVVGDYPGDNKLTSFWQTSGSSAMFDAINPSNSGTNGTAYTKQFDFMFNNFIVQANDPVTIQSSFPQGYMDYWMQNLQFEAVPAPGPLPLFGVGTAFACSRRIRRRCKAARRIESV